MDKTKIEQLKQEKEAELKQLVTDHDAMTTQFNQRFAQNQQRASQLEGMIAAYAELLKEEPEPPPS